MKKNQGLSLVELMVALSFFAITSAAIFSFNMSNLQLRRESQYDNLATQYANSLVEAYKAHWSVSTNYADGEDLPTAELDAILGDNYSAKFEDPLSNITVCLQTNRREIPCNGNPPLRRVTVIIRDQQGRVRAELTTEIGRPASSDRNGEAQEEADDNDGREESDEVAGDMS